MFSGSIVALVTPMLDDALDEASVRRLLKMHRDAGTSGVVPAGCTGEAATLSFGERMRLLEICLDEVGNDMPVIPGTGSNSTSETVRLTRAAADAGAPAALVITPYYNKPTPDGLYEHYRTVAEEGGIPIVLYNVPSRTGVSMLPDTIARLSELPNIVAIKEAGGSVDRVSAILELSNITVLSGDDPLTLPMMAVGAEGVVSVVANVLPSLVRRMCESYPSDPTAALAAHRRLTPIARSLFIETNPGPVKHVMAELGLIGSPEVRAPLAAPREETRRQLAETVRKVRAHNAEAE